MGSVIEEGKHLENGGSSVLISLPKYKMRKISPVRDFPPGCGPNATLLRKQTKAKLVQWVERGCRNGIELKACTLAPCDSTGKGRFSVEQHLLPYYPIPPKIVCKERKYPPPRRVSAVRDFPSGCGLYGTSLGPCQVVEGISDTVNDE